MRVMRLGIPLSSLVKWLRQARSSFGGCSAHDCGDVCLPEQGHLTSEERDELAWLRKENCERWMEKFFQADGSALLALVHLALPGRGSFG
jgi:hypothetical protein